jgi:hypothetical protein
LSDFWFPLSILLVWCWIFSLHIISVLIWWCVDHYFSLLRVDLSTFLKAIFNLYLWCFYFVLSNFSTVIIVLDSVNFVKKYYLSKISIFMMLLWSVIILYFKIWHYHMVKHEINMCLFHTNCLFFYTSIQIVASSISFFTNSKIYYIQVEKENVIVHRSHASFNIYIYTLNWVF